MSEKKQSILVVDDEPDIVDSLFDTFIDKYNMYKASNAKEALEIINDNQIDLIICDQSMPEITGVEFFDKIGKDHSHIGKILLTGYFENQEVVDCINKGSVDKCVTKPWDEDDILNVVFEVLNTKLKKATEPGKKS